MNASLVSATRGGLALFFLGLAGCVTQPRVNQLAPLLDAMNGLERPHGCWAYTLTTVTRVPGFPARTEVRRFDPSQTEETTWTLLARDGRAPTAEEQAEYRTLQTWRLQRDRRRSGAPARDEGYAALMLQTPIEVGNSAQTVTYALTRAGRKISLRAPLHELSAQHQTWTLDRKSKKLLHRTETNLEPSFIFGVQVDRWELAADYAIIDAKLPPFPAKAEIKQKLTYAGQPLIAERSITYSNYQRVECAEVRFETTIKVPSIMDYDNRTN